MAHITSKFDASPQRPRVVQPRRREQGFTLIEAALTTVIVGTGVLSIVAAQQAYHQKNAWAQRTGTAQLLANEIRELTLPLPMNDPISSDTVLGPESDENSVQDYDDLDDFSGADGSGVEFNPPINALRLEIEDLGRWTQRVRVENVLPTYMNGPAQELGSNDTMRITVSIVYTDPKTNTEETVTELSWVVQR